MVVMGALEVVRGFGGKSTRTRPDTRPKDAFSLVLIVVLVKNGTFAWFQLVCDRRTDGRTDGHTLL